MVYAKTPGGVVAAARRVEAFRDDIERAADEAGFDLCLVPEHHIGPRASIVAPLTLSAALAAVTSRIRIGPGIVILAAHHPLHVAEQVTMAPMAATGAMKKVIGTRSAVAMVAVKPGTAPTNRPNMAERTMVTSTSGWRTI